MYNKIFNKKCIIKYFILYLIKNVKNVKIV